MAWLDRLPPYLPMALMAVAVLVAAVWAYRSWQESHEDLEPVTGRELLSEFEQAHAAGELDEAELRRVRELLDRPGTPLPDAARPGPRQKPAGVDLKRDPADEVPPEAGAEGPADPG